jgi:hypothetical protein
MWTTEAEAMKMLGYKNKKTLRGKIYRGELPINMSRPSYKERLYSKTDIDNHINSKALY